MNTSAPAIKTRTSRMFGSGWRAGITCEFSGVKSVVSRTLPSRFMGLSGVEIYQDNIYVHANSRIAHDERLSTVLERLRNLKFQLNEKKCRTALREINILGTVINGRDARPDPEKMAVITSLPAPTSAKEVRSFLGLVQFYGRFIPRLSTMKEPLTKLTRNGQPFVWQAEQKKAFNLLKSSLCKDAMLRIFDPKQEVVLRCDASPVGIGAVLEQQQRPVLFVSKTLSVAERNYAQIEREALAIVWTVRRLHKYLIGGNFVLVTDNQPLQFIFNPSKAIPTVAAARIQRWALFLMGYDFKIVRVSSEQNAAADFLSRSGCKSAEAETFDINAVHYIGAPPPIDKRRVLKASKQDPLLCELFNCTRNGWSDKSCRGRLNSYAPFRFELSIHESLLYRGQRLVVPQSLQKQVISALHEGHPGAAAMKAIARQCVWWLGIDKHIDSAARSCVSCCSAKGQSKSTWLPWPAENESWSRVHIDFAGPFKNGQYALVMVDAYSKWPEVHLMSSITSAETIKRLQEGVPRVLVSDNGPSLVSAEMEQWLAALGCRHIRTPPFHPRSNGQAERFLRTLKERLL